MHVPTRSTARRSWRSTASRFVAVALVSSTALVAAGPDEEQQLAEQWARRDTWQRPDRVIELLALPQGAVVADLGAGKGYFTTRLARAVGPTGRVLALDINVDALELNRSMTAAAGLTNVEYRVIPPDAPGLAHGEADLVFISSTWHFLPDPLRYAARLRDILGKEGRIAVLGTGYELLPQVSRRYPRATTRYEVWRQAEAGDLVLVAEHDSLWSKEDREPWRQRFFMMFEGGVPPPRAFMPGFAYVTSELAIGPAPDSLALHALAERGFLAVADLRTDPASDGDAENRARAHGLACVRLPISPDGLDARALEELVGWIRSPEHGIVFAYGDSVRQVRAVVYGLWASDRLGLSEYELLTLVEEEPVYDDELAITVQRVLRSP